MALNQEDREQLIAAIEYTDFPAVLVFRSTGLSFWDPVFILDEEDLISFIESDECPEWAESHFSKLTDVDLYNAVEFIADIMDPAYKFEAQHIVDGYVCDGVGHFDLYASLDAIGYEDDGNGYRPEFDEDPIEE